MGLGKRGGALLVRPGITRLSQLEIDADKDWQAMGISNIAAVVESTKKGDLIFSDGTVLSVLSAGPIGMLLMTQGPGTIPVWQEIYGLPTAVMLATTDITDTEAQANAEIVYDIAEDCEARFRWREEGGAWTETAWQNGLRKGDTFYYNLSGLTPGTVYEVQCQARNPGAGEGHWSASETFMTLGAPLAATPTISDITDTEARLNSEITKDEDVDCEGSFRWRKRDHVSSTRYRILCKNNHGHGSYLQIKDARLYEDGTNIAAGQTYDCSSTHGGDWTCDKAFDEDPGTGWATESGKVTDQWVSAEFASAKKVTKLRIFGWDNDQALKDFILQADDGAGNWIDLLEGTVPTSGEMEEWGVPPMDFSDWTETPWRNGLRFGNPFHEDLSGLDPDTGHEVQSRARNPYGTGPWSATKAFEVLP